MSRRHLRASLTRGSLRIDDVPQAAGAIRHLPRMNMPRHHGIKRTGEEDIWQHFFERNPWLFGHGLNYVFLDKEGKKLEAVTTGATHGNCQNRVDALMRTRAAISQYVLIEIKKASTDLPRESPYRSGCWAVSSEVLGCGEPNPKTVYDFTSNSDPKGRTTTLMGIGRATRFLGSSQRAIWSRATLEP